MWRSFFKQGSDHALVSGRSYGSYAAFGFSVRRGSTQAETYKTSEVIHVVNDTTSRRYPTPKTNWSMRLHFWNIYYKPHPLFWLAQMRIVKYNRLRKLLLKIRTFETSVIIILILRGWLIWIFHSFHCRLCGAIALFLPMQSDDKLQVQSNFKIS